MTQITQTTANLAYLDAVVAHATEHLTAWHRGIYEDLIDEQQEGPESEEIRAADRELSAATCGVIGRGQRGGVTIGFGEAVHGIIDVLHTTYLRVMQPLIERSIPRIVEWKEAELMAAQEEGEGLYRQFEHSLVKAVHYHGHRLWSEWAPLISS